MYKAHQLRTTFGSWDVEKVHAVVARSTFASEKAEKHLTFGALLGVEMSKKCTPLWWEARLQVKKLKNTSRSEHFWKLRCRKSVRRCGAKHISKKYQKHNSRTPLWREAHFEVKMYKTPHVHATFGRWDVVSRGRRKGLCTFLKVSKTWGFCSISKNDGRRGTFEDDLQRCIFRGRRSTRDMFIRAARRSGADFLRGVAFWSLRSSGLLKSFWVTGAAPRMTWHHFFVGAVV